MNVFKSKLYLALSLLLLVVVAGVVGYMLLSDTTFINALYMTVITVTTVGFSEIHPLNQGEKLFTIMLILMSVITIAYAVSVITEYVVSGELFDKLKFKKVQKKIENLTGHAIVCGFGRNGKQAVAKLKKFNRPLVIIENNDDRIEQIEKLQYLYIKGDATKDEVLEKAGIAVASSLITTLPSDANNLYVVLSSRQLNKKMTIVSRASDDSSYSKLKIAGANNVIMPDKLGGDHMASLLVTPDIVEFVDRLAVDSASGTHLEEIVVDELPKEFLSKSIRDLDLGRKTGCNVIGFKNAHNEYVINPSADTILEPHSKLIILGNMEQIQKLNKLF
ncbi:potassium channel protein [Flavobacteriaceae bacterium F08102]|nr:potassium channel protein [Flavobacteriaceae bacterium F08102]